MTITIKGLLRKRLKSCLIKKEKWYKLLSILFSLTTFTCSSQDSPFVFQWHTGNELGVLHYEVQSSTNKTNWLFLVSVAAKRNDSNSYAVTLPRNPIYFRVNSLMSGNNSYVTNPVKLDTTFNISNIFIKYRQINFQSDNELNLKYYSILSSISGSNYKEFQQIPVKGNSLYISKRIPNKQRYVRISVVNKSGVTQVLDTRRI